MAKCEKEMKFRSSGMTSDLDAFVARCLITVSGGHSKLLFWRITSV
jgi:hypothetical protein